MLTFPTSPNISPNNVVKSAFRVGYVAKLQTERGGAAGSGVNDVIKSQAMEPHTFDSQTCLHMKMGKFHSMIEGNAIESSGDSQSLIKERVPKCRWKGKRYGEAAKEKRGQEESKAAWMIGNHIRELTAIYKTFNSISDDTEPPQPGGEILLAH